MLRDSADLTERASLRVARGAVPARRRATPRGRSRCSVPWDARETAVGSSESVKESLPSRSTRRSCSGTRARRPSWSRAPRRWGTARPQSVRAQAMRFRARMAAAAGDDDRADQLFRGAAAAVARAGDALPDGRDDARARRVAGRGGRRPAREADAAAEARAVFERLRAAPWLERAARVRATSVMPSLHEGGRGRDGAAPGRAGHQRAHWVALPCRASRVRPCLRPQDHPPPRPLRRRVRNVTVW